MKIWNICVGKKSLQSFISNIITFVFKLLFYGLHTKLNGSFIWQMVFHLKREFLWFFTWIGYGTAGKKAFGKMEIGKSSFLMDFFCVAAADAQCQCVWKATRTNALNESSAVKWISSYLYACSTFIHFRMSIFTPWIQFNLSWINKHTKFGIFNNVTIHQSQLIFDLTTQLHI